MTPTWLTEAARMPVAFAQVREDPRVDLAVLDMLDRPRAAGLMIASGGCTAAALVASGRLKSLHLVDANPAQLALTRLKLHLLLHATPPHRMAALGHPAHPSRRSELASLLEACGVSSDSLGPLATVAELGPDHAGRYELLFTRLRERMGTVATDRPRVTDALDDAFDDVMALDNLVALFGQAATQNAAQPFARHFAERTRIAFAAASPDANPFLWQLLVGRFPPGVAYDWLHVPPPPRLPDLTWHNALMDSVLSRFENHFDFIHLSHILDWLSPSEAEAVLRLTRRALRPGGMTVIRQRNSTLDLPTLGAGFEWLTDQAATLHATDRSFFYRLLHIGKRR